MRDALLLAALVFCLLLGTLAVGGPAADATVARFGYFWRSNTLPYDGKFAYQYDVAIHPNGAFAGGGQHSFIYVTAQNKHIVPPGGQTSYGIEAVMQYGYDTDNQGSIKRVWLYDLHDPNRFFSSFIDNDAGDPGAAANSSYFEMSRLKEKRYVQTRQDPQGTELDFLRVRAETVFIDEFLLPSRPIGDKRTRLRSVWENRFFFYNFRDDAWHRKAANRFAIAASRDDVRQSTFQSGDGIWAGILETNGDEVGPPEYGRPPAKKVVYANRSVEITDRGETYSPELNESNNRWVDPPPPLELEGSTIPGYVTFYRSTPVFTEFAGGTQRRIKDVIVRLFNVDDREVLFLNGERVGSAGRDRRKRFELGDLSPSDRITVKVHNDRKGYAWGVRVKADGETVFRDKEGEPGGKGANRNDRGHPDETVHELTVDPLGEVLEEGPDCKFKRKGRRGHRRWRCRFRESDEHDESAHAPIPPR